MVTRWLRSTTFLAMAFAALAGLTLGAATTGAQGTATPDAALPRAETPHPAHIHSGTCEELGEVVYPLQEVTGVLISPEASPVPTQAVDVVASPPAEMSNEVAAESITTVDVSLDDLLASEHAINVHESPENIQNYIACGNVTGEATDGELRIELMELNESGFSGNAVLVDNDDGTTTVTVTLVEAGGEGVLATPES